MTGPETLEFAAAIAGVCIGLAAALILAVLAIVGAWRRVQRADEVQQAAIRASVTIEETARRLEAPSAPGAGGAAGKSQTDRSKGPQHPTSENIQRDGGRGD